MQPWGARHRPCARQRAYCAWLVLLAFVFVSARRADGTKAGRALHHHRSADRPARRRERSALRLFRRRRGRFPRRRKYFQPHRDRRFADCFWSKTCSATRCRHAAGTSFRSASRWAGCFLYDLFVFSGAVITRDIDPVLLAGRGIVLMLIVPPLDRDDVAQSDLEHQHPRLAAHRVPYGDAHDRRCVSDPGRRCRGVCGSSARRLGWAVPADLLCRQHRRAGHDPVGQQPAFAAVAHARGELLFLPLRLSRGMDPLHFHAVGDGGPRSATGAGDPRARRCGRQSRRRALAAGAGRLFPCGRRLQSQYRRAAGRYPKMGTFADAFDGGKAVQVFDDGASTAMGFRTGCAIFPRSGSRFRW